MKVVVIFVSVQLAWSLSAVEDRFLMKGLIDYFDDLGDNDVEVTPTAHVKGSVIESKEKSLKPAALLNAEGFNRGHHYWTRKRGRESTTLYPFTLYPIRRFSYSSISNAKGRTKRDNDQKTNQTQSENDKLEHPISPQNGSSPKFEGIERKVSFSSKL
jgi:hypothetical protein